MTFSKFSVKTDSYSSEVFTYEESSRLVFRQHSIEADKLEMDVHADYWSLALFRMDEQQGSINVNPKKLIPNHGCMAVFLPPFSIVEWQLRMGSYNWLYMMVKGKPPQGLPQDPQVIVGVDFNEVEVALRTSSESVLQWLFRQTDTINIARSEINHIVAEKLKYNIDNSFREKKSILEIQQGMLVAPSMSSRLFKKKYGLSPVDYKKQLRMKQAAVDLMFEVPTVSQAQYGVGIEDSSYFHRCFKQFLNGTPGQFNTPSS